MVSHDAGGAEILSSWVRSNPGEYSYVLAGPAVSIFQKKLGSIILVPLIDALKNGNFVLTGTSWESDLELQAISLARNLGIESATFLDHWINFEERFMSNGVLVLPDVIWVGDKEAERIAMVTFPETGILLKPNPYVMEFQLEVGKFERNHPTTPHNKDMEKVNVLFLGENISQNALKTHGDENYYGYEEKTSFLYFLDNLRAIDKLPLLIRIRAHPSEDPSKYFNTIPIHLLNLFEKDNLRQSLAADIEWSDVVVGMSSMALYLASTVGKRTISCIPNPKVLISLPTAGIERLSEII